MNDSVSISSEEKEKLVEIGAAVLKVMSIPQSLPHAKDLSLATLERLYHNERVLQGIQGAIGDARLKGA
jgi:hypothetical protein